MSNLAKRCSRCKLDKGFSEFNKSKTGKFNLHNHCRTCQREVRRTWYMKNKTTILEKAKLFSKTNKSKQQRKRLYEKNKNKLLERNRVSRYSPQSFSNGFCKVFVFRVCN